MGSAIGMKDLLEAGVHFGHQTRRWNPKMKKYIFIERNGIYIVDLQKTLKCMAEAEVGVKKAVGEGGTVLFVGTFTLSRVFGFCAVLAFCSRTSEGDPPMINSFAVGTLTTTLLNASNIKSIPW